MKKNFKHLILGIGFCGSIAAQTITTGPSCSQSPYLLPSTVGYSTTSIFNCSQTVGNFTLSGILDGAGAFDNNDGTFSLLVNHEIGNTSGSVQDHGSTGAFVSKIVINKATLAVVSGTDLIQNVNLWNPSTNTFTLFNAANPSTLTAFGRFCSADLAAVSAYYNSYTGRGTQERIFMNGEETGSEGRGFAHIATGPNAGVTYQLPWMGRFSMENLVASEYRSDKTVVIGMDDATPGQIYVYIGNKLSAGNEIQRAGLVGGNLYGVGVAGLMNETGGSFPAANTSFSLINLGNVQAITGASLNTMSINMGVTQFLRPEDGAWDPARPTDFYFVTTNGFNNSGSNPSRMWRLRFSDINNPELGGTITAVLDGTEGTQMMDNIGIDNSGHIIIQEDPGNQTYIAKMWEYTIATDVLVQIAEHDPNRFITGAPNFLTQDEESSGIFDIQDILGAGKFLFVDQAHYGIPAPVVEGGQILMLTSLNTATSNPEINVQGNSVSIALGNTTIATNNNTNFGTLNTGLNQTKQFIIQNTGTGTLVVTSLFIFGANAGDFTFVNAPNSPFNISPGASQTLTVNFNAAVAGVRNAMISVNNNDFNENMYDFAVQGTGATPEINLIGNNTTIIAGTMNTSTGNNTNFGSLLFNTSTIKTFVIQNIGTGTLTVSGIAISGVDASMFTLVNAPTFPLTLINGASQTFSVQFLPSTVGSKVAMVTINNTDSDEAVYNFALSGEGFEIPVATNLNSYSNSFASLSLFPNPTKDDATIKFNLESNTNVAINVYDVLGKKVIAIADKSLLKGEQTISLNTSVLKNGEYFVEIKSKNIVSTIKLIVNH